eukprot:CAMPEP_0195581200 /NCGR_PEP_ID=MMETSP0814-20130614/19717_1 /TAXON_ID=97485 /ORGANISM="Prymnesium parvum, Strain Texoma1" /LENGTH=63 /DNA_ID=CAMNT_0040718509 /DNA_START=160 /DNA_END=348 /DNA_ORIENTATION=-
MTPAVEYIPPAVAASAPAAPTRAQYGGEQREQRLDQPAQRARDQLGEAEHDVEPVDADEHVEP